MVWKARLAKAAALRERVEGRGSDLAHDRDGKWIELAPKRVSLLDANKRQLSLV